MYYSQIDRQIDICIDGLGTCSKSFASGSISGMRSWRSLERVWGKELRRTEESSGQSLSDGVPNTLKILASWSTQIDRWIYRQIEKQMDQRLINTQRNMVRMGQTRQICVQKDGQIDILRLIYILYRLEVRQKNRLRVVFTNMV